MVPLQRVLCNTLKLKASVATQGGKREEQDLSSLFCLDLAKRAELIGKLKFLHRMVVQRNSLNTDFFSLLPFCFQG